MNIAIIGAGNLGGALAQVWAKKGHRINIGSRDPLKFKKTYLLKNSNISLHTIAEAVELSDIILMSVPARMAAKVTDMLGDTHFKIIIDAMNVVEDWCPEGYSNSSDCILSHTETDDVIKCFNTTGCDNILNANYNNQKLDMFMCGDSKKGKDIASQLALDAGFDNCYDVGGNAHFGLLESFGRLWLNLSQNMEMGKNIGFKLLKR